ncbi:DUF4824 family protein [Denitratimonas sp. CY0512]|uniref:DUF4824 family protein n=1 Tax=Denitratimonas sp. CY0512 TaxID=3131940 RepID=UPI0030B6EA44
MKLSTAARRLLWLGAALILAVNALILAGVGWNRSAEDSRLRLTERELHVPYQWGLEREKSALALQLNWRVAAHQSSGGSHALPYQRQARWLDAARLRELGFDLGDVPPTDWQLWRHQTAQRQAWLVLEFDGAAHAAALERAQHSYQALESGPGAAGGPYREELAQRLRAAQHNWLDERDTRSRLFVIDAGTDPKSLRIRYPDPRRYLIASGVVAVTVMREPESAPPFYSGIIRSIDIDRIHVPARFHPVIGTHATHPAVEPDRRYQVELVHGRRHQPWVEAVDPR